MLRRFGSFVFAVLVGSAVLAQTRQPLVGTVVDHGGKPVAGAAVTLVEDDVDLVELDPVDVCSVTTDARGRFVASALVGVRYTAVASAPEVDGHALVAGSVTGLSCGQVAVRGRRTEGCVVPRGLDQLVVAAGKCIASDRCSRVGATGFARWPLQPAARQRSTSSVLVSAVRASTGVSRPRSRHVRTVW